jgi:hypothetical protein
MCKNSVVIQKGGPPLIAKYAVIAAAVAVASPVFAVTVISNQTGAPDPGLPSWFTSVIDFEADWNTALNTVTTGTVITAAGSTNGVRASPAGNTTAYQSVGVNGQVNPGTSFFDFSSILPASTPFLTGFSLYWGSIDTYNSLKFFNNNGVQVGQTWTGNNFPPANGNQPAVVTNRRITFGFTEAENITGVEFSSTENAFEFDDIGIASPVPEPASWAMLIAGFGLVGATMRRRRQQPGSVLA